MSQSPQGLSGDIFDKRSQPEYAGIDMIIIFFQHCICIACALLNVADATLQQHSDKLDIQYWLNDYSQTSTFKETVTTRMGKERSRRARKLMVTKSWQDILNIAPMDIHPRTKCDTCIWSDRQEKPIGKSNHVVKSKQSVFPLKHKSENLTLLGGKSDPIHPGKVSKGEKIKPIHMIYSKQSKKDFLQPHICFRIQQPPSKICVYYNLAHYNNGLIAIQLPHPSTNKQVDDPRVMFKMHDTWDFLLIVAMTIDLLH